MQCKTMRFSRSFSLFLFLQIALCSPPGDPIHCLEGTHDCTVTNFMGAFIDRTICKAGEVSYPKSEEDVIALVAMATKTKRKMKVTTRHSHSLTKLVCPEGDRGLLISTKMLNNVVGIDTEARTMTVESGMTLEQFIKEAAEAGLALPYTPYFWGVTIGGLLSTGAHGSSLWDKGGAVHEYVIELRIVSPGTPEEGYVKVRTLNQTDDDLNAAKVSLGVLGVISQVTLQLQPLFKRGITYKTRKDGDLADRAVDFGHQHEFGDMFWYPRQREVEYRTDDRVPSSIPGNGLYDNIIFRSRPSAAIEARRSQEVRQELTGNSTGKCIDGKITTQASETAAHGLTNNGENFTGYPVIGYQHNLQAFGSCLDGPEDKLKTACGMDPRINGTFYYETAICIALPKVKSFIRDIQTLVSLAPKPFCELELYVGILLRYVKASTAYLGKQEDSLDFAFTYYRSRDPLTPRLNEEIFEEIEQMGLYKYGGLPHWGKNRNLAFDSVVKKYKNAKEFLKVKQRYDPLGLFSSEWTDKILGLQGASAKKEDGCALDGLCVCSQDKHCAPSKGYFCRPGKVYKKARVCTHPNQGLNYTSNKG